MHQQKLSPLEALKFVYTGGKIDDNDQKYHENEN